LRQVLCEQVELRCDLRAEEPADSDDGSEEREHDRYDGPSLGYSRPAAYFAREAAQQQRQKSGPESKHQHVRKLPDSKPRRADKAQHQNAARE
jgi:hypothetical protein